jgi:transposase
LGVRTISLDLRQRILSSYDNQEGARPEIAARFRVSLGLVKKLLQQRRRTGDIAPRHHLSGRKPTIVALHRSQLRALLAKKNDLTLRELRQASGLQCSLQAINVVLAKMGLTYKKRRSAPANRIGPILAARAEPGAGSRRRSTRPG